MKHRQLLMLALFVLINLTTQAQHTLHTDVKEAYFGEISVAKIKRIVDLSTKDTAYQFYLGFYDEKTKATANRGELIFDNTEAVNQFINDLDSLLSLQIKPYQRYIITQKKYQLTKDGKVPKKFLLQTGQYQTRIREAKAAELIAWVRLLDLKALLHK